MKYVSQKTKVKTYSWKHLHQFSNYKDKVVKVFNGLEE